MASVLIVEDQPELARLLAAALGNAGYEAQAVYRAREAALVLAKGRVEAVVLDLLLPDGLGFEVARVAKDLDGSIPVIGISGVFRHDPTVAEALRTGLLDDFFEKPFALAEILERLQAVCPPRPPAEPPEETTGDLLLRLDASEVEGTRQDYLFDPPDQGLAAALRARAEDEPSGDPEEPASSVGSLREMGVARLINAFHTSRQSGELHLQRGKVRKVIYFHAGVPGFAASNLRRDRFDELLLAQGGLDESAIRAAALEARRTGRRVDRVLLDAGLLTASRHRRLVTEQVKQIIFSLFPWREGTWRMTFHDRLESEPVRLDIFPADLILEGVHTLEQETLERLLSRDTRLAPAPAPAYELYDLSLSGQQALVVSRLDGTRTVADIAEEGWLSLQETWALLYGLWCLDVVEDASLLLL